jgi:hypothetical protein
MKHQKQARIGGGGPSTYLMVVVFALAAAVLLAGNRPTRPHAVHQ